MSRTQLGGAALSAGIIIFIGSRFRHHIDPTDQFLGVLMVTGFLFLLVGVAALRQRYAGRAGGLGRGGLILAVVGVALLTVGHIVGILLEVAGPWFVPIVFGTFLLVLGVLLFGVDAVRHRVMPRLNIAPVVAGVIGMAWIIFAFDSRPIEGDPEAFLLMRTLFGLAWLPIAFVLMTDGESTAEIRPKMGVRD